MVLVEFPDQHAQVYRAQAYKHSVSAEKMAEKEGFEPSEPARVHLISNQARSAAPAFLHGTSVNQHSNAMNSCVRIL